MEISETIRLVYNGRISSQVLNSALKRKEKSEVFNTEYTFLDKFNQIMFSKNADQIINNCTSNNQVGQRKMIYEVSCKIASLNLFQQLFSPELKQGLYTVVFKEPLKRHEIISISNWAKKNKKESLLPLAYLADLGSKKLIAPLPASIFEIINQVKKTKNQISTSINQFRLAEEEYNGLVEPLKKACVTNKERSSLLVRMDKILNTMFSIEESDDVIDFVQDAITLTRYSQARGCLDISHTILNRLPVKETSELYDEIYFRNIWQSILSEQYQEASKFLNKNKQLYEKTVLSSRNMFWTAIIFEKTNKNDLARNMFKKIVEDSPLEYYGILAFKKIKAISKEYTNLHAKQFESETYLDLNKLRPSESIKTCLTKINIWSEIKADILLSEEIANINFDSPSLYFEVTTKAISDELQATLRSSLMLNVAQLLSNNSMDLEVFKLIQLGKSKYSIQVDKTFLELIFPLKYKDLVWSESIKNQLDPIFTIGLIRQESAFNPYAQSPVGARGLMQIMPTTAKFLKRGTQKNELFSPEKNVFLGTKYLKRLTTKFDSNLVFVLAAYNAGDHRVAQWIKEVFRGEDDFLKIVESIPFSETNSYVKLIYRNIYFYKMLYGQHEDTHLISKIFDLDLHPSGSVL